MSLWIEWNTDVSSTEAESGAAPAAEAKATESQAPESQAPESQAPEAKTLEAKALEALLTRAIEEGLKAEGVTVPCEVSLTITTPEEIHELNKEYRNVDRPTDVLSFPMLAYAEVPRMTASAGEETARLAEEEENLNPETGELVLGDIVINLEQARAQAAEYGHSLEREVAFLAVHSLLHLLGYDHETEEEEKVMFQKQEAILQSMGLIR